MSSIAVEHVYEVRPRKDDHGVDLISDALPFGRLWYDTPPDHAVGYAIHSSRSHDAVIRVYDHGGNVDRKSRGEGRVQRSVISITSQAINALAIL